MQKGTIPILGVFTLFFLFQGTVKANGGFWLPLKSGDFVFTESYLVKSFEEAKKYCDSMQADLLGENFLEIQNEVLTNSFESSWRDTLAKVSEWEKENKKLGESHQCKYRIGSIQCEEEQFKSVLTQKGGNKYLAQEWLLQISSLLELKKNFIEVKTGGPASFFLADGTFLGSKLRHAQDQLFFATCYKKNMLNPSETDETVGAVEEEVKVDVKKIIETAASIAYVLQETALVAKDLESLHFKSLSEDCAKLGEELLTVEKNVEEVEEEFRNNSGFFARIIHLVMQCCLKR